MIQRSEEKPLLLPSAKAQPALLPRCPHWVRSDSDAVHSDAVVSAAPMLDDDVVDDDDDDDA